jgi:hypothetical protein
MSNTALDLDDAIPLEPKPPPAAEPDRLTAWEGLIERGWRVHPCNGKVPILEEWPNVATIDQERVAMWCEQHPDANPAIATGAGSGIIVVDVDDIEAFDAWRTDHGPLPETVTVQTPSGGRHLYFRHPGQRVGNRTKFIPGCDLRGDGGYVIAPAPGNGYSWAPELGPDDVEVAELPAELLKLALAKTNGPAPPLPERLLDGQRNATLTSLAGTMRRRGATEPEIQAALEVANRDRCQPPLDDSEVAGIAASVGRYPPANSEPEVEQTWPGLPPEALHGLAGDIIRALEPHTEADPVALLAQLLIAFGSAVGRGPYFMVEADRHGCNESVVLVGETARGRKGVSLGHVRRLFADADSGWTQECVGKGLSSGEGLLWAVRDPIYRINKDGFEEIVDPGVPDKRLLVIEHEFAQVLKVLNREGNTLSPILRDAWDGHSLRSLVKTAPARATDPHISTVGHITATELRRHLQETEIANGYANRVLWLCVRRSKLLPEGGQLNREDLVSFVRRMEAALDHGRKVGQVQRTPEAREVWCDIYRSLSADRPGLLGAMIARAEAHVVRLALIYALLDCSNVVAVEHLSAALGFWKYAEDSARYVFGRALGDPVADRLLELISSRPDGVTRSEMYDALSRHVPRDRIATALRQLEGMGAIEVNRRASGGRPAEVWTGRWR